MVLLVNSIKRIKKELSILPKYFQKLKRRTLFSLVWWRWGGHMEKSPGGRGQSQLDRHFSHPS
jgi:hypothetical protein